MNSKNKKIECPVCKSTSNTKYWAMPGYKLARCNKCSFVWDHDRHEDVLAQYDKSYFKNDNPKGGYTNYFEGMRINKKTFIDRLSKIAKKLKKEGLKKERLLDVGAALGDCLEVAQNSGWKDSYGVEVSSFAVKEAKKRGVKNIFNTTLEKSKLTKDYFNAITYQDVIEHVEDPIKELKTANKYLKKGGFIFLVTPDVDGLWHKLLKSLWYHYKPGEHIMYFNQKSLKLSLEKAGFKNIETRKTYHVLSVEYIFNRLKFYVPWFFELLIKVTKNTPLKNYAFRAYTGEIEAWGQKS